MTFFSWLYSNLLAVKKRNGRRREWNLVFIVRFADDKLSLSPYYTLPRNTDVAQCHREIWTRTTMKTCHNEVIKAYRNSRDFSLPYS